MSLKLKIKWYGVKRIKSIFAVKEIMEQGFGHLFYYLE